MCESTERQFFNEEAYAKACQEIERLRMENSKLKEQWLELMDEQLSYTGLPGHLHRLDVKIKQLKSLLVCAADALENVLSEYAHAVSSGTAEGGRVNDGRFGEQYDS